MADQLPIISGTRAVNTTATPPTSLIGRGLSAIHRKETGIARTELDARYKQARDIYNRITDYGWQSCFNSEAMPKREEQFDLFEYSQLQPFFAMLQQLVDVFIVFQQLAVKGYGKAYFPLAKMYGGGQGISKNIGKFDYYSHLAFDWCFANQALDDSEIWVDLGWMYENDRGAERDYEQAIFLYRKAAEQGCATAQCDLGLMYYIGRGVKQDDEQAEFWYRKATEQGDARAQHNLGMMYQWAIPPYGRGVQQDDEQAVSWYRKAAEQGYATAQYKLGLMYYMRFGGEEDDEHAVFWYRKAAEQGHATAQCELGSMYEKGCGVAQDNEQSLFWKPLNNKRKNPPRKPV